MSSLQKPANNLSALLCLLLLLPLSTVCGGPDNTDDNDKHIIESATASITGTGLSLPELIHDSSQHFTSIETADLDGLLERIADSRLVLIGDASHGTAEFYEMRARISRELIEKKAFNIVAIEADWPDAESIDYFIAGADHRDGSSAPYVSQAGIRPFSGFPSWMWANQPVLAFTHWLKEYNQSAAGAQHNAGFYGLDLYNLYGSLNSVIDYLQPVDPVAAAAAYRSYRCLMPWAREPALYSRAMQSAGHRGCLSEVTAVLHDLQKNAASYRQLNSAAYFNAEQNARLVKNGEAYYRSLFVDNSDSWNQRDHNMFETLLAILEHRGQSSKAVVWVHNSHIGDARATDMSERGEFNLGQLVRQTFADDAYLIGFGSNHGSVAAASKWGGAMEIMHMPAARKDSYEYQFHRVKTASFLLPLRAPLNRELRKTLLPPRLQRAIGTLYDPGNELNKHYSRVSLPRQFDEYIWFDETRAVSPLQP